MTRLRLFLSSMVGRLFLILLVGMSVSALCATLLVNAKREQEFQRQQLARTADRLQGFVHLLDSNPEIRGRLLAAGAGVRQAPAQTRITGPDLEFAAVLAQREGLLAAATVERASFGTCMAELRELLPEPSREHRRERPRQRDRNWTPPRCRVVGLTLSDGEALRLTVESSAVARDRGALLDPWFLSLLLLGITVLAYAVARIASAPLQRLASAATELGQDLQRAPLPISGPLEVRRAAEAFNAMQQRLQRHLSERTQMLAAITHDLQTPLTRLRLRLENVGDEALRERLVADLAAMQALIREGLELARSAESAEQRAALDLDSLLESISEDMAEAGHDVMFEQGSGAVLMLRPMAMHRLFSNLIDNAVKYGGSARVRAQSQDGRVEVRVRDAGPGIPEEELDAVFTPFLRLETSRSRETGGAGLGLTIARALAEKDGAALQLRNHPEGGLEAIITWEKPASSLGFRDRGL
jgi:signal transduction histidine kinase